MQLIDAAITILVNQNYTTIQLHDRTSGETFVEIELTPEQLSSALSRLSFTKVKSMEVTGLENLNKKLEVKKHVFEIPDFGFDKRTRIDEIHAICLKTCPEGWKPDKYYDSQGSFFEDNGKHFTRATIRTWVAADPHLLQSKVIK